MSTTYDPTHPDFDFLVCRGEFVAAGRPTDHPYLAIILTPAPIRPLVAGITDEMVAAVSTPEYRAASAEANTRNIAALIG